MNERNPTIKQEAFDLIYRQFMDKKQRLELKLSEQRKIKEIQKDKEMTEFELFRKRTGTQFQVNQYVDRVQKDIRERNYKAEK